MPLLAFAGLLVAQTSPPVEAPLNLGEHWVIEMNAEVSGRPLRLLFSTGAERTILRPDVFERITGDSSLNQPDLRSNKVFQSLGTHEFRIGGIPIGQAPVLEAQLLLLRSYVDGFKPFDGILGRDVISQRTWFFDFVNRRFKVLSPTAKRSNLPRGGVFFSGTNAAARGYFLPTAQWEIKGNLMVDTGATVLALHRDYFNSRSGVRTGPNGSILGIHGPLDQSGDFWQNHYMVPSLKIGGLEISYPVVHPFLITRTQAVGVEGPYVLGLSAIAFMPDGSVGIWARTDRDFRLCRSLQRVTGLNLTVRGRKIFIQTELPEDKGREYEVVTIRGYSVAELLSLMTSKDPLAIDTLSKFWSTKCEVELRRSGRTLRVVLEASTRS